MSFAKPNLLSLNCPRNIGWPTEVRIGLGFFRRSEIFGLRFTPLAQTTTRARNSQCVSMRKTWQWQNRFDIFLKEQLMKAHCCQNIYSSFLLLEYKPLVFSHFWRNHIGTGRAAQELLRSFFIALLSVTVSEAMAHLRKHMAFRYFLHLVTFNFTKLSEKWPK